jgi:hypothetical protein
MARTLTILGKTWQLVYSKRINKKNDRGLCDEHASYKTPKIRIKRDLCGEERLEVLIHEMMHAANWPLDEGFVSNFSIDAARELTKLGYRNVTEETNG